MIVGPPLECSSNDLADWLELEVLASETDSAPLQAVNLGLEIGEDEEPADLDEEGIVTERRLQKVVSAIDERTRAIPGGYPYTIDKEGHWLRLKPEIAEGGYAYLFCLIVSAGAPNGLLDNGPAKPDLKQARTLFQVCATLASAGCAGGPAFSTGWPRPDSLQFLEKLRVVYGHYGDGRVHEAMPPGAPRQVKDDEIDVIAWQYTHAVRPPMGYFLGQAASGADWTAKSLKGHVDAFHATWFAQQPAAATRTRLGTIMPFCLPSSADADSADHEAQDEIEGRLHRYAAEQGEILHRHRVASFLTEGMRLHARGMGPIERVADLPGVINYVTTYRQRLREVTATL